MPPKLGRLLSQSADSQRADIYFEDSLGREGWVEALCG